MRAVPHRPVPRFPALLAGIALVAAASGEAPGTAALEKPAIGCLVSRQGGLHQVAGVRGNLVVSAPLRRAVREAVCDGDQVLASEPGRVVLIGRSGVEAAVGTEESDLLLAVRGEVAAVLLPGQRRLLRYAGGKWESTDAQWEGEVVGLEIDDSGQALILDSARFPGASAAAVAPVGTEVWAEGRLLHVRRANGARERVELPQAAESLHFMSPGWLRVRTAAGLLAVFVDAETPEWYALPGDSP